jgi:hypothetical protein
MYNVSLEGLVSKTISLIARIIKPNLTQSALKKQELPKTVRKTTCRRKEDCGEAVP